MAPAAPAATGLLDGSGSESDDDDDGGVVGEDEHEDHYDPGGDEADLALLTQQRASAMGVTIEQVMRITTDAILSCPGCFTTICSFGSQRHARQRHRYRALLAENVVVHTDRLLPSADPRATGGNVAAHAGAHFRVSCELCGTDVGFQDAGGDERAFHFTHVLPSEA
ncbi:hypothetical protein KFE25_010196 [Diacronema lutheri]|uniref:Uncharacterized protein n=1 Tax=Diacronema lutheri TaxID=2081491 RepID=A0A8J6CEQ6_DIALT|nr:hypothetical protein KFE25_010196 [Diacronema lutheri]